MAALLLDDRLQTAASLFSACEYGADIGADHGRLSCYLLEKGICQRMCVADISAESLKKADELLTIRGLKSRADVTVGDGLTVLQRPAQAIAILGMGGHTIARILENGKDFLQGAALIVSAHTEVFLIRETMMKLHYRIDQEKIALAGGRFYVLIRAVPGDETYTEQQCHLGPRLMESNEKHYGDYLAWQICMTAPKRTELAARYMQWLKEEEQRVCDRTED
ncbi:MAG: SAM-dependent methyltransferase [Clostridia bacterium]|nr:SAM-dependent methyltransferase [Clostridia bacterium]